MAQMSLKNLSFDELLDLRERVDGYIRSLATTIRADLQGKLARVDKLIPFGRVAAVVRGRKSLKGRKVPPKYRNPKNRSETWAGRGGTPRWLQAQLKKGKKLEDFAIG